MVGGVRREDTKADTKVCPQFSHSSPVSQFSNTRPASESERAREPDAEGRVNACYPIVGHDAQAAGKRLRLPRGKRLSAVEYAGKK